MSRSLNNSDSEELSNHDLKKNILELLATIEITIAQSKFNELIVSHIKKDDNKILMKLPFFKNPEPQTFGILSFEERIEEEAIKIHNEFIIKLPFAEKLYSFIKLNEFYISIQDQLPSNSIDNLETKLKTAIIELEKDLLTHNFLNHNTSQTNFNVLQLINGYFQTLDETTKTTFEKFLRKYNEESNEMFRASLLRTGLCSETTIDKIDEIINRSLPFLNLKNDSENKLDQISR